MKITKEMLAEMRAKMTPYQGVQFYCATCGQPDMHTADLVTALLDERKAMREALKVCVPDGGAAREMRDLALLGGEDEQ